MSLILNSNEPSIVRGIKTVGVGKKGSKPLSPELIDEIIIDLKNNKVPDAAKGALIGALLMKGLTPEETKLEAAFEPNIFSNPQKLIDLINPQLDSNIKTLCVRLMRQEILSYKESKELGDFLFSNQLGDTARGLVASILRVRYETPEEYEGLLEAIKETFEPEFSQFPRIRGNLIQLADPFDGVDQTNIITPLVADYLQTLNYHVVSVVGKSSGPKFVYNLNDIANGLHASFIKSNVELCRQSTVDSRLTYGYFLDQADLSKSMDRWVDIRRQIIKRPFLATLERFVNPFNANILIASAFHAPYGEKMMTIAERAGFPNIIIIRNGIEGSTAFALKRPVKILISVKKSTNDYLRHELEFDPETFLNKTIAVEEKLERPDVQTNIDLIKTFKIHGKTSNELFDDRVKVTCAGLKEAIDFINQNKGEMS